ncbi:PREDICTED: WD repeat-containing protein 66 [Colobus angolensis palliatus]|uniref:WD repeat-containing protein 66 n=1 Tax=Colobus angolensis palliatus TaxID=336983 RepID=UPI0005F58B30|nr:PREDICTED: WD repeat-containing protein 66 [Colobus angolensis palliatus]
MSDAEEAPREATGENGETEMKEEEEPNPNYKEVENLQQESKDNTLVWREAQEEERKTGEEEGEKEEEGKEDKKIVMEETEEVAGEAQEKEASGIQEETTVEPQEVTESMSRLETQITDSQSITSGIFPKTQRGSKSKPSLQLEDAETDELLGGLSTQLEFLDLDQISPVEQQISSPERQPSGELEEKTDRMLQDELGRERRDLEPENREEGQESRVSDIQSEAGISRESLVSSTTEDILFERDERAPVYPLTMTWSFGWNSSLPVYYIREEKQRVLLYVCAHTAIIYNVFRNNQHHLQGHANIISCLCVSEDRRWIATADKGPDCLVIIWDSFTGIPVHTIFDSCPEGNGIRAMAMTHDAKYLATISDAEVQKVCIWKWTLAVGTPACTLELPKEYGVQNYLIFNPTNNKELVSNSKTQAIYYAWTFNKLVGRFSQSIFHLNLTQILSATMEGKLVVWDIHRPPSSASTFLGFPYIKPCKLVHLQKEGITVLTTIDSYIVTGDIKGNIKFYDHTLSIVNWYSHLKLGAIRTLSFSKTPATPPTEKSNYPPDCTLKGDLFVLRNFIIGTSDAAVYHLTTDGTKLEKLFVEPKDAICAISCHPYQPLIAIGSICGMIKVWNYENKQYLFSRVFEKGLGVQSLTYNPEGALLGAGFTEGTVYVLDAMSLENESPEPFKYSRTSVTHISFSHDSQYMATADRSFTVAVYMLVVRNGQRVWEYLARLRSHRKSIRSLLFGVYLDSNEPRLLSLGTDRLLIEYDLLRSYKDYLQVLDIHRTDQGCYPTCMVWYPPLTRELFLLICNSGYKVKLFNATTKMCRKTLMGPAYGSPIEQTQVLPVRSTAELQKRYLVFINRDKVGLQILPVDGNPHKTSAIVCHPNGVAGMAVSCDGRYAFTAGGHDRSVVQWKITLSVLEAAVSLGGEDLTPFYGLLSGGREGKFYRELEDYFYYSQLRSQGIDTMETRKVSEYICLSELPFVMRAIGFYPSEEKELAVITQSANHLLVAKRKALIKKVFRSLESQLLPLMRSCEHMTEEEMLDCFASLFGLNPEGWKSEPATSSVKGSEICLEEELPDEITAEIFATEILGLTISEYSGQDGQ